jgi:hypothetical protein
MDVDLKSLKEPCGKICRRIAIGASFQFNYAHCIKLFLRPSIFYGCMMECGKDIENHSS